MAITEPKAKDKAKAVIDFYEVCSRFYHEWQKEVVSPQAYLDYLLEFLAQATGEQTQFAKWRYLDLGCATGDLVKLAAAQTKWQCTGMDISSKMIEQAQKELQLGENLKVPAKLAKGSTKDTAKKMAKAPVNKPAITWQVADILDANVAPQAKGSYNLISAFTDVLNHFQPEELACCLQNVYTLLSPGGYFVCDLISAVDCLERCLMEAISYEIPQEKGLCQWTYRPSETASPAWLNLLAKATAELDPTTFSETDEFGAADFAEVATEIPSYLANELCHPQASSELLAEFAKELSDLALNKAPIRLINRLIAFYKANLELGTTNLALAKEMPELFQRAEVSFIEYHHWPAVVNALAAKIGFECCEQAALVNLPSPSQDARHYLVWRRPF